MSHVRKTPNLRIRYFTSKFIFKFQGTSLKILFGEKKGFKLKRNEIVSLIVTLAKFSETIRIVDKMFERRAEVYQGKYFSVISAVVLLGIFLLLIHEIYKALPEKMRKKFGNTGLKFFNKKKEKD